MIETLTPVRIAEICRRQLTRAECVEVIAVDPARMATNLRLLSVELPKALSEREVALAVLRAARMQGGLA